MSLPLVNELAIVWADYTPSGENDTCVCHICETLRRALALVDEIERMPEPTEPGLADPDLAAWAKRVRKLAE